MLLDRLPLRPVRRRSCRHRFRVARAEKSPAFRYAVFMKIAHKLRISMMNFIFLKKLCIAQDADSGHRSN
jgi:hypothetical protein